MGNSPVTGEFPAQRASKMKKASIYDVIMVGSANGFAPQRRQTITCTFDNQVHLSTYVSQGAPYYCYGSTLIPAWISNNTQ